MLRRLRQILGRLHRDEQGIDTIEYILLVAFIALPLVAVALIFRDELWTRVRDWWDRIAGDTGP
ncbi:MAG: hypothetical protein KGY99_03215 [Phycisphaerae bacterium]|nr:hypothetical protein [Phycisphaerae bacterium]